MKFLHTLVFALLFLLGSAQPVYAQSNPDEAMKTVQDVGQWTQAYFAVVDHLMPLFINEHLDQAIMAMEKDDQTTLSLATTNYAAHRNQVLGSMQSAMTSLPQLPSLAILGSQGQKMENTLKFQQSHLSVLYNEAELASGHLNTVLKQVGANKADGILEILRQQILASIRLLEAEIVQLDAGILAIPDDNPNHAFQLITKAHAKITIEEMRMELLSLRGPIDLAARQPHVIEIGRQLDIIERNINVGSQKMTLTQSEFKAYIAQTAQPDEKAFFSKILKAVETFGPQMDVERKVLALVRTSHAAYAAPGSSEAYADQIEANDNGLIALDEERSNIMKQRIDLIAGSTP